MILFVWEIAGDCLWETDLNLSDLAKKDTELIEEKDKILKCFPASQNKPGMLLTNYPDGLAEGKVQFSVKTSINGAEEWKKNIKAKGLQVSDISPGCNTSAGDFTVIFEESWMRPTMPWNSKWRCSDQNNVLLVLHTLKLDWTRHHVFRINYHTSDPEFEFITNSKTKTKKRDKFFVLRKEVSLSFFLKTLQNFECVF